MKKVCKKCNNEKDINQFPKNKKEKDGYFIYCKSCEKERRDKYNNENREKVNERSRTWRKNNPEKYKQIIEKYLEKNPNMESKYRTRKYREDENYKNKLKEKRLEHYKNNVEEERLKRKNYFKKNRLKERKKNDEWRKKKLKNDPIFRMKKNIRSRIIEYIKGKHLSERTFNIIGLKYEEFKIYIENQFTDGMSWENYGKWDIDHIIPLCTAKNEEEIIKLNHYTNLRPYWHEDNKKRNRKYGY